MRLGCRFLTRLAGISRACGLLLLILLLKRDNLVWRQRLAGGYPLLLDVLSPSESTAPVGLAIHPATIAGLLGLVAADIGLDNVTRWNSPSMTASPSST